MNILFSQTLNWRLLTMPFLGLSCLLLLSINDAFAHNSSRLAPRLLIGSEIVLQVEFSEGDSRAEQPSQGVIVQNYLNKKNISFKSYGDNVNTQGTGRYRYRNVGKHRAIEKVVDTINGKVFKTRYVFNSPVSGKWERTIDGSESKFGGSFILNKSNQIIDLAPENHDKKTLVLSIESSDSAQVPAGNFPAAGSVVFQNYKTNGEYEGKGFGVGTVDHLGTYTLNKVAPNVLIEQTSQTIPAINYTAEFTMVYTYKTPYSGTWYQNFANGLIIFSGTFITFETNEFNP